HRGLAAGHGDRRRDRHEGDPRRWRLRQGPAPVQGRAHVPAPLLPRRPQPKPRGDGLDGDLALPGQQPSHPRVQHDEAGQHPTGGAGRAARNAGARRAARATPAARKSNVGPRENTMVNDIIKSLQGDLDKAIEAFRRELAKVRTGRANLSILDGVRVDYYGTPTPLNQVASLNVADARLITIKPWERSLIPEIEKSIRAGQLGLNPQSDGELVRLPMPALTQERRQELVKVVKKMAEESKVALRGARRDANEMLKEALKEGAITEDDERKGLKTVQETTDKSVTKVDEIVTKKEAEILEV